jgi:hypothetical protein
MSKLKFCLRLERPDIDAIKGIIFTNALICILNQLIDSKSSIVKLKRSIRYFLLEENRMLASYMQPVGTPPDSLCHQSSTNSGTLGNLKTQDIANYAYCPKS